MTALAQTGPNGGVPVVPPPELPRSPSVNDPGNVVLPPNSPARDDLRLNQQRQQPLPPANTDGSRLNGFLNLLFSPIRLTIDKAMRLFSHGHGAVRDGVDEVQVQTFKVFMQLYNKSYSADEIPRRMALYFERRRAIEESVKMFRENRMMFVMKENIFVDWDDEELKKLAGVSPPAYHELTEEEKRAIDGMQKEEDQKQSKGQSPAPKLPDEATPVVGPVEPPQPPPPPTPEPSSATSTSTPAPATTTAPTPAPIPTPTPTAAPAPDTLQKDSDDGIIVRQNNRGIPESKDWRTSGCISTPINQMKCGACYAIATMSVVETQRCLNNVEPALILSSQQIVDCATARAGYQNFGCDGGWPTRVFKYLQDVGIASRESCYPFVRTQNACRMRQVRGRESCVVPASSRNANRIQYKLLNNERDILRHVATTGPVVTVLKASDKFLYYGSGIFDDPTCSRKRDDVDHAVVIVGYGRQNGIDYWLIKNSWGTTSWGQGGYGLVRRGVYSCSIGHWGWAVTG